MAVVIFRIKYILLYLYECYLIVSKWIVNIWWWSIRFGEFCTFVTICRIWRVHNFGLRQEAVSTATEKMFLTKTFSVKFITN